MKKISIIIIIVTLFSCDNKFPDYIKKEKGVYMKLLSFDEGNKTYLASKHAVVSVKIFGKEGLLYRHYKEDVINLENYELVFLIKHLAEGDSANFMVSIDKLKKEFEPVIFNATSSSFVEVVIKVHNFYTKGEYLSNRQGYDKEMMEQLILTKYLEETNSKPKGKIFKEVLRKGEGEEIKKGDIITIAYKGYFVNRLEFDNISGSTAFTFTYGTPGQVIKGLDIAIKGMKKGEKSKIIIPSQFAFGEEGSTTRVVPPYTTVIYELEIVNVKSAKPKKIS